MSTAKPATSGPPVFRPPAKVSSAADPQTRGKDLSSFLPFCGMRFVATFLWDCTLVRVLNPQPEHGSLSLLRPRAPSELWAPGLPGDS